MKKNATGKEGTPESFLEREGRALCGVTYNLIPKKIPKNLA